MKPIATEHAYVQSSSLEEIRGRIDTENIDHIMSHLSAPYTKPIYAVVREYSTNARDAHIEAGKPDVPIRVSLTEDRFIVEDEGPGLSLDELRDIFLNYGASTKRDTDEQVGFLGFGTKSGVSYAGSGFLVVSSKNGRTVTATVARNETGVPVMHVLADVASGAPSGVRIEVPVSSGDWYEFSRWISHLFRFWEPGTVLVDGEIPPSIRDDAAAVWVDPDVAVIKDSESYVVMGGVPYRVDRKVAGDWGVVAFVPMGSVGFTLAREELQYTTLTNDTLDTLFDFVSTMLRERMHDFVNAGDTPWERVMRYSEVRRLVNRRNLDLPKLSAKVSVLRFTPSVSRNSTLTLDRPGYGEFLGHRVVRVVVTGYGYTKQSLPANRKQALLEWARHEGVSFGYDSRVMFVEDVDAIEFLDGWDGRVVHWDDIAPFTPKRQSGGSAGETEYRCVVDRERRALTLAEIVALDRTVVFVEESRWGNSPLNWLTSDYVEVWAKSRSRARIERGVKRLVSPAEAREEVRDASVKLITDADRAEIRRREFRYVLPWLVHMPPGTTFADPVLTDVAAEPTELSKAARTAFDLGYRLEVEVPEVYLDLSNWLNTYGSWTPERVDFVRRAADMVHLDSLPGLWSTSVRWLT